MNRIKKYFEDEAQEFDQIILNLIPFYHEMFEALVLTVPFDRNREIRVIDLGCGTETVAKKVKETFPNAKITCLDLAENMIKIARIKMQKYENVNYLDGDFYNFKFSKEYDVFLASLALHHLLIDEDKKQFYKKIFDNLSDGGVFYNADVVLGTNDFIFRGRL